MKLATFRTSDRVTHAGVVHDEWVIGLDYPTVLELLRDPEGLARARRTLESWSVGVRFIAPRGGKAYPLSEIVLLSPIPEPPSVRDFYAFEQHVKSARAKRGLGMIPEWYEIPTFYFTNNSEIYGHEQEVPYPVGSNELDIELEIACVIWREGKDISLNNFNEIYYSFPQMIAWASRNARLRVGDILDSDTVDTGCLLKIKTE